MPIRFVLDEPAGGDHYAAMQRLQPVLKLMFWFALAFAFVAATLPPSSAPSFSSSDKVNHMIAFFTLAVLASLAWPRQQWWRAALLLSGFGALIEIVQAIPALHRDADVSDWLADMVAIGAGLLAATPFRHRFAR